MNHSFCLVQHRHMKFTLKEDYMLPILGNQYHARWCFHDLTHWGRVTQICVGKLTIIGSDNGLSPGRHQAIIWTNAEILLIGPLGTNLSENLIGIQTFSFKKMHLKISSAKWRLFPLGLNELRSQGISRHGFDPMIYEAKYSLSSIRGVNHAVCIRDWYHSYICEYFREKWSC